MPTEQALFLTRLGEPFRAEGLTDRVRRIVRNSGIGKPVACHAFRHAAATAMLEGRADIRFVQAFLGHAKLTTTKIYTHVTIMKLKEVYAQTHPAARFGKPPGGSGKDGAVEADAPRYRPC